MSAFYLDTSALTKRYRYEIGTPVVNELFERRTRTDILVTSLFFDLEITSALARPQRTGVLTEVRYLEMRRALRADLVGHLVVRPVSDEVMALAVTLTADLGLKTGDAVHLATALDAGSFLTGKRVTFVGSDHRLNTSAASRGLEVLDPEADTAMARLRELRLLPPR